MQLKDVAVLITGGGSGLGAATARAMAAKGARIGVIDQNKENAEKVAAEVKGVALHADVTDEDGIKAAIAKAEAAHGVARVLMNCAGIGGSQRIVGKDGVYPLAKFARIINVNLIGTFNCLRLFAERLVTAEPIGEERGVIINTASVAAYEGQIGQIAYSASKGGVVGLTLPAARDLASQKIRVNSIECEAAAGDALSHKGRGRSNKGSKRDQGFGSDDMSGNAAAVLTKPAFRKIDWLERDIAVERRGDGVIILKSRIPLKPYEKHIPASLAKWAKEAPSRIWLAQRTGADRQWRQLSYGEAKRTVDALTQGLLNLNLEPGRPVAILSGNSIEHALMTQAAMQARLPAAPVSPAYSLMSQDHLKLKYLFDLIKPAVVMVQDGPTFEKANRYLS